MEGALFRCRCYNRPMFKRKASTLPHNVAMATIGFTLFDLSHIIVGIYFFELAFRAQGGTFVYDVAASATQIVLSVLLLLFIMVILEHNTKPEETHRYFAFAWLVACVSTLLPEVFRLPSFINGTSNGSLGLLIARIAISGAAFLAFGGALFTHHEGKLWKGLLLSGVILIVSFVPIYFVDVFDEASIRGVSWFVFAIIEGIAPLYPAALTVVSFFHRKKEPDANAA